MGDHEGRRHDLEAEHAVHRRLLQVRRHQRVAALVAQGSGDAVQHLDQVRARAATRVQHDYVGVGQAVGQIQLVAQDLIHAGDLVLDDLRRGVPDAEGLAQLGVVGFQERFIKVLNRVLVLKRPKNSPRSTRLRTPADHSSTSTSSSGPSRLGLATSSYNVRMKGTWSDHSASANRIAPGRPGRCGASTPRPRRRRRRGSAPGSSGRSARPFRR